MVELFGGLLMLNGMMKAQEGGRETCSLSGMKIILSVLASGQLVGLL